MTTKTDKGANWQVDVPADITLKPGDDVKARDEAGNESTVKVGNRTPDIATSVVSVGR
ncbi:hypothetical protein ACUY2A_03855 [Corynebacterium pilbarense]